MSGALAAIEQDNRSARSTGCRARYDCVMRPRSQLSACADIRVGVQATELRHDPAAEGDAAFGPPPTPTASRSLEGREAACRPAPYCGGWSIENLPRRRRSRRQPPWRLAAGKTANSREAPACSRDEPTAPCGDAATGSYRGGFNVHWMISSF